MKSETFSDIGTEAERYAKAKEACSIEMLTALKRDGLVMIPNFVPKSLVIAAKDCIDSNLEECCKNGYVEQVGASSRNLFNLSPILPMMEILLGPRTDCKDGYMRKGLPGCQIAIRMPGSDKIEDLYDPSKWYVASWHIDGLHLKSKGEINSFDILVGVLLSDVEEAMSGELGYFPGGHKILSKRFREGGFDELMATRSPDFLKRDGNTARLFPKGFKTTLGKAGDVVIAHYMTPHFITPNTTENVRCKAYFRVAGPSFVGRNGFVKESMLDPFRHWRIMDDIPDGDDGDEDT